MIKKSSKNYLWVVKRGNIERFWGFSVSSHFSASQHSLTPPKLPNRCNWVSYNIP